MLAQRQSWLAFLLVAVVAILTIVGAQALANYSAPPVQQLSQSKIIGQTGFAYLGGLRMMGAGLLWGRLDAQFHQYGGAKKIQDRLDLLPSIRMVQLLNPQLELPYYYTSFILYQRGKMADALALAKEGVANNPTSGLLRANYAQLLFIDDKRGNLQLMLEQAQAGLSTSATYNSIDDEFESFGIFRTVYQLAGDKAKVKALNDALAQIDAQRTAAGEAPGGGGGFLGLLGAWTNSATGAPENVSGPATSTSIVK